MKTNFFTLFRRDLETLYESSLSRILMKPFWIPYLLLLKFYQWLFKPVFLEKMDLHILSKCTLNCKYCSTMMPFFEHPQIFPKEEILADFAAIQPYINRFDSVNLIGGEPLLHPDLPEIIDTILRYRKVKKVTIVTNGTIYPSDRLIQSLKHKKCIVIISNYFHLSRELNRILTIFRKEKIHFILATSFFNDYGRTGILNRSEQEQKDAFSHCLETLCRTYLHGKLYLCPASAQMDFLNQVKAKESEFIDFRKVSALNKKVVKKSILQLLKQEYVSACNYCVRHYVEQPVLRAAEQMPINKFIALPDFIEKERPEDEKS